MQLKEEAEFLTLNRITSNKKRNLSIKKQEKGTKLKMNERIERSSGEDRSRPEEGDEN